MGQRFQELAESDITVDEAKAKVQEILSNAVVAIAGANEERKN